MTDALLLALGELIRKQISARQLLQHVVEVMAEELEADRCTIFILDDSADELVSVAAQLPEIDAIRVPVSQGVAGYVARTGRLVNIPYCDTDAHFWTRIDEVTGYHTRTMLAGPLRDGDGALIGVVEFLNKKSGIFTEADERAFAVLSEQAASLLAETTLGRGPNYLLTSAASEVAPHDADLPFTERINGLIGRGRPMQDVYGLILRAAATEATVLLRGESGTGKGLVARAIHDNSPRHQGPCIHLDCTTLPEGLMENELFGHERGAYTGAHARKIGLVEAANRGSLFLDEIGDLPLPLQGKLLTLLQDRTYNRVGGTQRLNADIRIIAATNRDLEQLVRDGLFREDLYYRLRVVEINLPALRERGRDDLIALINHFVDVASKRHKKHIEGIRADALAMLLRYSWPGNVRELENCLEAAIIFADHQITPSTLPLRNETATMELPVLTREEIARLREGGPVAGRTEGSGGADRGGGADGVREAGEVGGLEPVIADEPSLRDLEARYIRCLLEKYEGNRSACARILDIGRNTLLRKMKEYGLE